MWLYDERGSRLYEEITRLPDYYLPQREAEILRARSGRSPSGRRHGRSSSSGREARRTRGSCSTL